MQAEVFPKLKKILLIDDDRTVITPIAVSQWTDAASIDLLAMADVFG